MSQEALLRVEGLRTVFQTGKQLVRAVDGVSFTLNRGETLGIAGESGSGKSVTMLSILQLVPRPAGRIVGGEVLFEGSDLLSLDIASMRKVRGKDIAIVFQDPMTSLNPVLNIKRHLMEPLQMHLNLDRESASQRAIELLRLVGIPDSANRLNDYPHQFSGGMRQRVMIALALACQPKLLIADEPTTALDVTIQAQIVELVKRLREDIGMSIIWITHDMGILAGLADRILVMYAGRIVEAAPVEGLYQKPYHPYTAGLLRAVPRLDTAGSRPLVPIPGRPPDLAQANPGCAFAPRCAPRSERCFRERPPLVEVTSDHYCACWLRAEAARVGSATSAGGGC